jgi:hypothetical protein
MDDPNAVGNTPDNNYVGTAVDPKADIESNEKPLDFNIEAGDSDPQWVYFKHKQVQRFEIPRGGNEFFAFKHGMCRVHMDDVDEFLTAVKGLHGVDRGNIVQILNIQNERSVESLAVRGPAATTTIKAATEAKPASAAPNPGMGKPAGVFGLGMQSRVVSTKG